jgi:hypothetical protein
MSRATDNDHRPASWGGINRNTGKPFNNNKGGGGSGFTFNDDAGGDGSNKNTMSKAGGQPGSGGPATTFNDDVGGGSIVNFPDEIGSPKQPNYMTFRTWKITSAVGGTMGDINFSQTTSAGVQQVALPIPTGVGTNYAQGWDQSDVNAVQGSLMRNFGSSFGNAMKSTATSGIVGRQDREGGSNSAANMVGEMGGTLASAGKAAITGVADIIADPVNVYNKATGAISNIAAKIGQSQMVGNAVAGVGLGVAGKVLGDAGSTAMGVASFNQTMAFYQGPQFRTFNFSYQLLPQSPAEQRKIKQVVDFFKTASAPEQISSGLFRIYELPFVFTINFYGINGEMEHINKIAHCALTAVQVAYGGDRFNTFAGTDAPVQTNIQLAFKEIELVTKKEMEVGY